MATYRAAPLQRTVTYLAALVVAILGVAVAFGPGAIPAEGILLIAGALIMLAAQATSRLVVTASGLSWRNWFRTTSLAWDQVQAVDICPARSLGQWWSPRIHTGGMPIRVNCVLGTRAYAEQVAAGIRAANPAQSAPQISSTPE
jgi:hypothetical protein